MSRSREGILISYVTVGTRDNVLEVIIQEFVTKLHEIVNPALRGTTCKCVVSRDLLVTRAEFDTAYDSVPKGPSVRASALRTLLWTIIWDIDMRRKSGGRATADKTREQ